MSKFTILLLIMFTVSHIVATTTLQAAPGRPTGDVPNANYYYNQGVDYFQRGDSGKACLYWLRALNLNSAHPQARANLNLAISLSPDSSLYPPEPFLSRAIGRLISCFSVNRLAWWGLFLFLGLGACVVWLLGYDPDKERALPIIVLSVLIIVNLSTFTALGIKRFQQVHNHQGVIIVPRCQLYNATNTGPLLELHAGLIVHIVEQKSDSYLVRLPDGRIGRILATNCERVLESGR